MPIKPRLKLMAYVSSAIVLSVGTTVFFGTIDVLDRLGGFQPGAIGVMSSALVLFAPVMVAHLLYRVLKRVFVHRGWMTLREAECFPPRGHWPDAWCEVSDHNTDDTAVQSSGTSDRPPSG